MSTTSEPRLSVLLDELASTWAVMAEMEKDAKPGRRETLRECADGVRMLADIIKRATAVSSPRPALVTALRGLLASLSREPTEFELRAAAHEFTVMADRAAAAARAGGDDA